MAWTTNDEDLLILSDDSDAWSEFVLDEQILWDDKNSSSNNSDFISFDSDLTGFDISTSDETNEKSQDLWDNQDSNDFMLSFDDVTSSWEIIENISSEVQDLPVNDDNLWFSLEKVSDEEILPSSIEPQSVSVSPESQDIFSLDENTSEDTFSKVDLSVENQDSLSNKSDWLVWTMADILDEAIAKFAKREDIIAESILSKEEHIKSLREQIASLESAVNTDNEEVSRLNTEKQSIVKNRKALEKMKELPTSTK